MTPQERTAILLEAQGVVLWALAQGYASGAKAKDASGMPGWKYYEHIKTSKVIRGVWVVTDKYYVHPDTGRSTGSVTLEHTPPNAPPRLVWVMYYGGSYMKSAIPCLKGALMANYSEEVFHAGRGQDGYTLGDHTYVIQMMGGVKFESFSIHELVYRNYRDGPARKQASAGGHFVRGLSLI